jgi:5'-methylthioadenosine phosphorylase
MVKNLFKNFSAVIAFVTLFFPLAVSADVPADIPKARIAVLGGTFLNDVIFYREGIIKKEFTIETKVDTSPEIHYAEWQGVPFY